MNDLFSEMEDITSQVKDYIHTGIDRIKLKTAEKTSLVVANIIAVAIVSIVFLLFLVFISVAGAYAISGWIGRPGAGFLIISIIYFLLGIIIWKGRERIIRVPVMNHILAQLFKNKDEDEKDN